MRILYSMAAAGALALLTGCASTPTQEAILQPVGPAPTTPVKAGPEGRLQVYTARQGEPLAVERGQWWRWDSTYAPKVFPRGSAHSSYIIRTAHGSAVRYVSNARNSTDATPTVVTLPVGRYQVLGQAEESNGRNVTVLVPVVIEQGRTTVVHLSRSWKPTRPFTNGQVVRLPDGQIAGWLAEK